MNERIRGVAATFIVKSGEYDVFCECGRPDCVERLAVPAEIFDRIRHDNRMFVVRPGHEFDVHEHVLDHSGGYAVVLAA